MCSGLKNFGEKKGLFLSTKLAELLFLVNGICKWPELIKSKDSKALDTAVTHPFKPTFQPILTPNSSHIYAWSKFPLRPVLMRLITLSFQLLIR